MARAAEVIGGEHRVPALSILDQARLYYAIARHTVLVMAALAICAVTAALLRDRTDTQPPPAVRPDQLPPAHLATIPLTVPEITRPLTAPAGRAAQLLSVAPARYLDRFGWRPASGIAYLALLAAMPLTGVAGLAVDDSSADQRRLRSALRTSVPLSGHRACLSSAAAARWPGWTSAVLCAGSRVCAASEGGSP